MEKNQDPAFFFLSIETGWMCCHSWGSVIVSLCALRFGTETELCSLVDLFLLCRLSPMMVVDVQVQG